MNISIEEALRILDSLELGINPWPLLGKNEYLQRKHTLYGQLQHLLRSVVPKRVQKQTCDNCGNYSCYYPDSVGDCSWRPVSLLAEYEQDVLRTKNNELSHIDQLTNAAIGAAGESGELSELVKKHRYQGHDFKREKYIDETGDALFYLTLGLLEIGSSLEETIRCNIKKRENIYPDGFDAERSRGRKRG